MTGVRDYSTGELKHNVVALARAAKALKLPIVVTTTARDSMWGPTFPELVEALPGIEIVDRSSVNAFDDARVARAIEATGRKKLIFAGISLEVCAAFPAMTAVGKGLDAYVAVDASGTFSETKRQVGLLRMLQAGVILSDYATLMVEISRTMRDRRPARFTEPWTWAGPSLLARSPRPTENNSSAGVAVDASALASAYNL
jgi:nicotinamidase-related amidase